MKILITVFLLIVVSLTVKAQKLEGKWNGKMSGPNGDFELTFTFNVTGDSLSGNVSSQMGILPIENGKINGEKFSFDVDVNGMVINHDCVLVGDEIKMSVPFMDQAMEIILKKEESKINGKWVGNFSTPQGEMEITYQFIVNGNTLTGTDTSAIGNFELLNGVVEGNSFSFDIEMQGMKIGHECKYLEDDSIDMLVVVMGQESLVKLNRVEI